MALRGQRSVERALHTGSQFSRFIYLFLERPARQLGLDVGPRHRLVMDLDAPDTHVEPARLRAELVARPDRAGPERPGDDGPDPAESATEIVLPGGREMAESRGAGTTPFGPRS